MSIANAQKIRIESQQALLASQQSLLDKADEIIKMQKREIEKLDGARIAVELLGEYKLSGLYKVFKIILKHKINKIYAQIKLRQR